MKNIKRIPNVISIPEFIVTFEYETRKGYRREQQRTIFATDKGIAKWNFGVWANEQRTMSNVKILGIVESNETKEIHV